MDHLELKSMREALGISQSEMALRLTMHRNTYLRWESGATKKLPLDLMQRVVLVAKGVAVHREAVGEEMVLITPGTHPQYYDKVRKHGWLPNQTHPTGYSGPVKRKYLDALVLQGRSAMEALQLADEAEAAPPVTAKPQPTPIPLEEPPYVHVGQDDAELEKRIQSFFSNPT